MSVPNWLLCPVVLYQHSQSIVPCTSVYTAHMHANTYRQAHSDIYTQSLRLSHLGACAYSVHYSGQRAVDHFLIVAMLFN